MEMIFNENPLHSHTKKPVSRATESQTCLTIKRGNTDCPVYFYPAQYQLTLVKAGVEEKLDLGFSGSRLLARLLQTPDEVVSREDLMSYAWSERVVGQGSLNQQIYTLRQILGDEKDRDIIQTLPRRGYMLSTKHITVSTTPLTLTATTESSKAVQNSEANGTTLSQGSPALTTPFTGTWDSIRSKLVQARMPIFTLVGIIIIAALVMRESPPSAEAQTGLSLTYAPETAAQMLALVPLGEAIIQQLEAEAVEPLQLVLGSYDNIISLICLRSDGSAHSLHLHENQISTLSKTHLAPCL